MNRLFIFEFVSGGGFNTADIPISLFCEGFGMLKSIIADFKAMNFEVSTLLDYRISYLWHYLNADHVYYVNAQDNYLTIFKKALLDNDSIFIIAPEFFNILHNLTKLAKDKKKQILSIGLKGIQIGTSKIKTHQFFIKNHIASPETYLIPSANKINLKFIAKKLTKIKTPIVIKPDDGVGAESIYYFENQNQLHTFFSEKESKINCSRKYIIQKYIQGEDLSASLIGYQNNTKNVALTPIILSINSQDIHIKTTEHPSEYFGGNTPIADYFEVHKLFSKILDKLDLSMFNSYFGIDFIRTGNFLTLIEINPRLTTSYIGVRNVINMNPVEIIIDNLSNNLPSNNLLINKHSLFKRLELNYEGKLSLHEIFEDSIPKLIKKIPEIVTPPISFNIDNQSNPIHFSSFIATKEKDFNSSNIRFNEILSVLYKDFEFSVIK